MAKIKKIGRKHCVIHSTSGTVLVRKGKRACYSKRADAVKDARNTKCRNLKLCPVGVTGRVGP